MSKFADLLFHSGNPVEAQERADRELPRMLAKSHLHLWNLGDAIVSNGTRFLLGIVTWSLYDLRLLDALNEALSDGNRKERVDIFNLDSCQTKEEISLFVPHIGKMIHPPVVGVWRDGQQVQQNSGAAGRNILVEAFALNHEEIISLQRAG
ncbi:MAG TPA: hypothetical protein VK308_08940 [Pyrinomonadaceae bacterium]|nr:hypothetical protein [Pyrinomonadaceae bacterium]